MLRGAVTHASAAPNGDHVAYFSQDGALNLYLHDGEEHAPGVSGEYATGYPIRWSPGSKSLAFSSAAGVFVFDVSTGRAVRKVVGRVSDFSFDARGRPVPHQGRALGVLRWQETGQVAQGRERRAPDRPPGACIARTAGDSEPARRRAQLSDALSTPKLGVPG